ncbi:hypothetical protein [Actinopolymorpha pittospori]|uniref:Uncharacterized protein n=1 Tax=Actinopolymorpha pittospori TaxID=648752 RepID=A0A927RJH6_9ACTN|nr:hypothetical protein [Actinopolymorpha pittospori]MBE1607216.1 hypothetical protein [Actinopolymorpha pittospori]
MGVPNMDPVASTRFLAPTNADKPTLTGTSRGASATTRRTVRIPPDPGRPSMRTNAQLRTPHQSRTVIMLAERIAATMAGRAA